MRIMPAFRFLGKLFVLQIFHNWIPKTNQLFKFIQLLSHRLL